MFKLANKKNYDENIRVLQKSEVKRIAENVTKKELTDILGIGNNHYINCVTGINNPSFAMTKKLKSYLDMNTVEVYKAIYETRQSPYVVKKSGYELVDGSKMKGILDERLEIEDEDREEMLSFMKSEGKLVWD